MAVAEHTRAFERQRSSEVSSEGAECRGVHGSLGVHHQLAPRAPAHEHSIVLWHYLYNFRQEKGAKAHGAFAADAAAAAGVAIAHCVTHAAASLAASAPSAKSVSLPS